MNVLIIDLNYSTAATAVAANDLVRCLLGAGSTALVLPMLNALGRGWTYTALAGGVGCSCGANSGSHMPMGIWLAEGPRRGLSSLKEREGKEDLCAKRKREALCE